MNEYLREENLIELTSSELNEINGGDDITKAVFYALGWAVQKISDGFAAAGSGSPGAYIPNR
jgi:hypothetical protein